MIVYFFLLVQAKVFSKSPHTVQLDNSCTPSSIPKSNLGIVVFIHAGETFLGNRGENLPTELRSHGTALLFRKMPSQFKSSETEDIKFTIILLLVPIVLFSISPHTVQLDNPQTPEK